MGEIEVDGELHPHLQQLPAPLETGGGGHLVVLGAGLGDPEVHVPATFLGDDVDGGLQQLAADLGEAVAVVGVDDELQRPGTGAARQLGIRDGVAVAWLPRHEPGEPFLTSSRGTMPPSRRGPTHAGAVLSEGNRQLVALRQQTGHCWAGLEWPARYWARAVCSSSEAAAGSPVPPAERQLAWLNW